MSPRGAASIEIERVAETGSTNADLIAWARTLPADPAPDPTPDRARLLVADRQTAGRGRRGREWHAMPGASLTFSLAWPMRDRDLSGLSLAVGVAIAETLDPDRQAALRIGLKWPNDLWLVGDDDPGRKLGGILIETTPVGAFRIVVIGVGLNVRPQAVPDASSGIASLHEIDVDADAATVLDRVVPALSSALQAFEASGFASFATRFERLDLLRGQLVRCDAGGASALDGTADGVSPAGELKVRTADDRTMLIGSGGVSVRPRRAASPDGSFAGASC